MAASNTEIDSTRVSISETLIRLTWQVANIDQGESPAAWNPRSLLRRADRISHAVVKLDATNTGLFGLAISNKLLVPSDGDTQKLNGLFRKFSPGDPVMNVFPPTESDDFDRDLYEVARKDPNLRRILRGFYTVELQGIINSNDPHYKRMIDWQIDHHICTALQDFELADRGGASILYSQLEAPLVQGYREIRGGESPDLLKPIEEFVREWERYCDAKKAPIEERIKARYIFLIIGLSGVGDFAELSSYMSNIRNCEILRSYRITDSGTDRIKINYEFGNASRAGGRFEENLKGSADQAVKILGNLEFQMTVAGPIVVAKPLKDLPIGIRQVAKISRRVFAGSPAKKLAKELHTVAMKTPPLRDLIKEKYTDDDDEAGRIVAVLGRLTQNHGRIAHLVSKYQVA